MLFTFSVALPLKSTCTSNQITRMRKHVLDITKKKALLDTEVNPNFY
jgi:hypothetical protein